MSRIAGNECCLWYELMAFSPTGMLIYIYWPCIPLRKNNQTSLASLYQQGMSPAPATNHYSKTTLFVSYH